MTMMMLLFLLLFNPRNLPLNYVAFVVLVILVGVVHVVVVDHVFVVVLFVVDPTNLPLKFG